MLLPLGDSTARRQLEYIVNLKCWYVKCVNLPLRNISIRSEAFLLALDKHKPNIASVLNCSVLGP